MIPYYFRFYRKILSKSTDAISSIRLRILFSCIISFIVLTSVLTVIYSIGLHYLLLSRVVIFLSLFTIALALFVSNKPWHMAAHFFLTTLTLLIWSNTLLVRQSLYVINIQYGSLVIAASFYLLGAKNGIRYSLAAITPIIGDVLINQFLEMNIPSRMINLNHTGYAVTIILNFSLILYIHYLFFKALNKFKKRETHFKHNLEKALAESREQAASKTNFLNTMSHEIRTPLNAVVGMSHLLLKGQGNLQDQRENLNTLHYSAQNLMATINDIIDFNSIDNNQVELKHEPFNLHDTVMNTCATFRSVAADKHIEFECFVDDQLKNITVYGDELRLSQILFHVLSNAVKFTSVGFVKTMTNPVKNIGKTIDVAFCIEDSGIGISRNKLKQILDPFKEKIPRTQKQYQGTLGLTIAHQLIALHGSRLKVRSTEGKGSLFRFVLRYNYDETRIDITGNAPTQKTADISKLKVLVVDDEKINLMVVKKILSGWNINADDAPDGQAAVEMANTNQYDVVLMDINMPVMDGFEASKRIKLSGNDSRAPYILALTASIGAAIQEVADYPFIDDCLLKPFDPEELKKRLEAQASNRS